MQCNNYQSNGKSPVTIASRDRCFLPIAIVKGIAKGGVKNRNKGECKRLFAFVHVCSRLLAFASLRLLAFVSVCLRLFAFARICLRPPFVTPPLCATLNRSQNHSRISPFRVLSLVAPCSWEFNCGRGRGWESRSLSRFRFALILKGFGAL